MWNISRYSMGMMGYQTPNIDRIGKEGAKFTDWYGQQSCTGGRACFITGQNPIRTGLTKVGMPGATVGLQKEDPTIAELPKPLGYATGQFGKNHLGDRNEYLPTMHGFDEFFGNLYHLNAEEEPELPDYPKVPGFKEKFGPRGVLHCVATDKEDATTDPRWGKVGKQTIKDTGPLTKKHMENIDEEITSAALDWMEKQVKADKPFFLWYNSTAMHFRTHLAAKNRGKSGRDDYSDRMVTHDEQTSLPAYCRECSYLFACHGECPKNRFLDTPDGEAGLNYLCAGLKAYFAHIDPHMGARSPICFAVPSCGRLRAHPRQARG
jgi:arylsulfatase